MKNRFPFRRSGSASSAIVYLVGSLVAVGVLGWFLIVMPGSNEPDAPDEIVLYCAAGIKKPVAEAVKQFQEETFGFPVRIQYGGSGTLLTNLQAAKTGDLYLAADVSYINIARDKGVLAEAVTLAKQRPVIAVKKGNPKNIGSIDDLLKSDVKLALANPDAASVGKLTKNILTKAGKWEAIEKKTKVFKPTVNDIIADVELGAVDAAIVWDANVKQKPDKLDMVRTQEFDAAEKSITIGVLKWTKSPAHALRLARYLQAPKKGGTAFQQFGYDLLPNPDEWAVKPKIHVSSGGVNRVAIDKTLKEFAEREGVNLSVSYNGCGIIVGEIKGGSRPDAYFACDVSFMVQVQDKFHDPRDVSQTDMVIVAKKGNPKQVKTLKDLAQSGLRVGVANPEQSALGELTRRLLKEQGLLAGVTKNVKYQAPTADLLVNQILAGKLDAAVVYRANTSQVREKLAVLTISVDKAKATQPIAIGRESKYPHLMQRLVDALTTKDSQTRFESADFRWLYSNN